MVEMKKDDEAESSTEVSPEDLKSLTPERLQELKSKYGLEIEIRSSRAGIAALLTEFSRESDGETRSPYDRGGYDRTGYDRTPAM
ncbi:hypothetical protein ABZ935_03275 [Streptomyces coeruleorubidus]|uniref:hypothetical protein n=1 Tax=Streptomyces coeruleorubidus TaxID=116188 RepID=UPI0033D8CEDF